MVNKHFFKNQIFENGSLAAVLASGSTLKLGGKTQSILGSGMRRPTRCSAALLQQQTHKHGRSIRGSFLHDTEAKPQPNQLLYPAALPPLPQRGGARSRWVPVCGRTHNQSELLNRQRYGLWL